MPTLLTSEELKRYARHLILPEFGSQAQEKLKQARVLVVGAGGLGCPLLMYLTAAGVGHIGIVDYDRVDDSNLQRQVLYDTEDIGFLKAEVAARKLKAQNPHVQFTVYTDALNSENALEILSGYDVVADGTDNFPTRYLVNDACVLSECVNVYASIFKFEGQISVFNHLNEDGQRGPNYRDIFPEPPPPGMVPSCAEAGVIGVLPGMIGCLQANEVIKVITGIGTALSATLLLVDALNMDFRKLNIKKDPANPLNGDNPIITELIDYEAFCGAPSSSGRANDNDVNDISAVAFKRLQDSGEAFVLIDVREQHEYDQANIGGVLIPLGSIQDSLAQIPKEGTVIVHCRSGARSAQAIHLLEKEGYSNLMNLQGGILAYAEQVDDTLEVF